MKLALPILISILFMTSCIFGTGEHKGEDKNTNDTISQDTVKHRMPWDRDYAIKYFDGYFGKEKISLLLEMKDTNFRGRILFHTSKRNYLVDGYFSNNHDSLTFSNIDTRKFSENFTLKLIDDSTYSGKYSKSRNRKFTLKERNISNENIQFFC